MISPLKEYEKRKFKYNSLLKKEHKYKNNISNLRLAVFILGIIALIIMYLLKKYFLFDSILLDMLILLFYLAYIQKNITNKKKLLAALYEVNEISTKRLNGRWKIFNDNGEEFIDKHHKYSYDLDIFGNNSLFQWMNTAHTYVGRLKLKEILTEKPQNEHNIYDRQSAIMELGPKVYFRQRLEAEGKIIYNNEQDPKKLFSWIGASENCRLKKQVTWILKILSMVTAITSLMLAIRVINYLLNIFIDTDRSLPKIFYVIPYYVPIFLVSIQCIILRIKRKDRLKNLVVAEKYNYNIKMYKGMLKHIEKYKFKSKYILNLYKKLYNNDGLGASKQLEAFSRICGSIANRRNMLYSILNPILLLDYHWNISVESWKIKSGKNFKKWIDVIGELEVLSSISTIKYNNPCWTMPKIINGSSRITAKTIGHPLLGEKRVCNSLNIGKSYSVMLITGSNMSGKSTFMRTVGVNIILAYTGAPVCAEQFCCTIIDLYTCMRIDDNLAQNISSFYAEILKIKNIVKASKERKNVLFLLDEIFKGTNSIDRHTGAMILISQLSRNGNLGIVSTHDLELGKMADYKNSKIKNYHFSEYYTENKIYFDYKLKLGISSTRNAVYLMKLAGIEIEAINEFD
ncbi:DNA mismatch repair protein [Clostridium tyrobutyricum]|uniref:MutS-related protein n=2 Tax=Clostridium tyrobutyricum TaxID=1519 RepID=UPI00073D391B|nr:DNA mismatch repair protein [Clostridium tyrobutyricum]MBV4420440.1 DNA mismatch repair protein [Clostridium tyrobutyricum]MBV4428662.1 DNA mismatch repair protein [Clostridium tyrobutyricum]MBV4443803.1 DNA mismatch repair protein [Clostridium tyrobutyricum]MBV4447604.1 DNA mismatch repair protein [Clostridium tyrobutyricum]MBV4450462.1 DNA mismatch repair protein [Clostridium tyrobutyricum]